MHCTSYLTGKGAVERRPDDTQNFQVEGIHLRKPFARYKWVRRVLQEVQYGRALVRRAAAFGPDVILSSNDPLFAKAIAGRWCRRNRAALDLLAAGSVQRGDGRHGGRRLGPAGEVIGERFKRLERRLSARCAGVVAITDDFLPILEGWGIDAGKIVVINELGPRGRDRCAAPQQRLGAGEGPRRTSRSSCIRELWGSSTTPGCCWSWRERFRRRPGAGGGHLSGPGSHLAERAGGGELPGRNSSSFLTNPTKGCPEVLATGEVLAALLTGDAAVYSVPSKVLTYLCAGRPIVAAVPAPNLIARTLEAAGAGEVVPPNDAESFARAVGKLLADEVQAELCGQPRAVHAESAFDIEQLANKFEPLLIAAVGE